MSLVGCEEVDSRGARLGGAVDPGIGLVLSSERDAPGPLLISIPGEMLERCGGGVIFQEGPRAPTARVRRPEFSLP